MARSPLVSSFLLACAACAAAHLPAAAETVLLDFTSEHCPPCRTMDPILGRMAAEGYHIRQVDAARDAAAFRQFRVDSTPTFIVLVDGVEWARLEGATSRNALIELMHRATALARAEDTTARGPNAAGVAPVDFASSRADAGAASAIAQPHEGRVVPIQDPFAVRTPSRATVPASSGTGSTAAAVDLTGQLLAATVRIRVTDPSGKSTGTGVVVDARNGAALVLTCGHIFRESGGAGPIEISLFDAGPQGVQLRETAVGELLDYDLQRDLALVRFAANSPVAVTPIAPPGTQLAPGDPATSVGCSHGENPTIWPTRITALNRFQTGHPNVEAARAPVEGRSGGPLFNAAGQVIGICFASDHEGDEGLYASLPAIQSKLDELNLSMVYQAPSTGVVNGTVTSAPEVASALPDARAGSPMPPDQVAIRGQNPPAESATTLPGDWPARNRTDSAQPPAGSAHSELTPEDRAGLEEIVRRGLGSEVICIIRPHSPEGRSQVIKLQSMSPAFVQALTAAAGVANPAPATAATPAGYLR